MCVVGVVLKLPAAGIGHDQVAGCDRLRIPHSGSRTSERPIRPLAGLDPHDPDVAWAGPGEAGRVGGGERNERLG